MKIAALYQLCLAPFSGAVCMPKLFHHHGTAWHRLSIDIEGVGPNFLSSFVTEKLQIFA